MITTAMATEEIKMKAYVENRDGGYWVSGTRVSLDSVVYRFLEGLAPETIADCFPALTLEQVYGAITYYLSQRGEMDAYFKTADHDHEAFRQRVRATYPGLSRRLDELLYATHRAWLSVAPPNRYI